MGSYATGTDASAPTKRRWFRYSLRSFLLCITLICAWLGWKINAARQQRSAVAAIRELGGNVSYDFDKNDREVDRHPSEPAWLIGIFGADFFHDVVDVDLTEGSTPKPKDFDSLRPHLRHFPRLQYIVLSHCKFDDGDFQYLASFQDLRGLWLRNEAQISGVGFRFLTNLKRFNWLMMEDVPITDLGVEKIKNLASLEELYLQNARVTDASIESLVKPAKLRVLDVKGTKISDDGVRRLHELRPNMDIRP